MTVLTSATLFLAFVVALVVPGQDFVLVVRMAVSQSLRVGVAAAAGTATGLVIWGTASMLGVAALLENQPAISGHLQHAGAAVLVALGLSTVYGARRSAPVDARPDAADAQPVAGYSLARSWGTGLVSNLSNVKLLVFFTGLFTSLVPGDITPVESTVVVAAMGAIAFGWFALIALLGSRPRISSAYQRARRRMDIVFGLIFVAIGVALFVA